MPHLCESCDAKVTAGEKPPAFCWPCTTCATSFGRSLQGK